MNILYPIVPHDFWWTTIPTTRIEPGGWELWAGCPWRGRATEWRRHLQPKASNFGIILDPSLGPNWFGMVWLENLEPQNGQSFWVCHHLKMRVDDVEPSLDHPRANPLGRPWVCLNLGDLPDSWLPMACALFFLLKLPCGVLPHCLQQRREKNNCRLLRLIAASQSRSESWVAAALDHWGP